MILHTMLRESDVDSFLSDGVALDVDGHADDEDNKADCNEDEADDK